jgi:hypothetical protein
MAGRAWSPTPISREPIARCTRTSRPTKRGEAALHAVLIPWRYPKPCRPRNAGLDTRRRRTRLRGLACLRSRFRHPHCERRCDGHSASASVVGRCTSIIRTAANLAHVRTPGGPTGPAQSLLRLTRSSPTPRLRPSLTQSNRRGTDPYARWWGSRARCAGSAPGPEHANAGQG